MLGIQLAAKWLNVSSSVCCSVEVNRLNERSSKRDPPRPAAASGNLLEMQILRPHLRPKKPSGWFRHLRSPGLHIVGVNIRAAGLIHELASVTVASEQIPSQSCGGVIGLSLKGTYFSRCPGPALENPLNPSIPFKTAFVFLISLMAPEIQAHFSQASLCSPDKTLDDC